MIITVKKYEERIRDFEERITYIVKKYEERITYLNNKK